MRYVNTLAFAFVLAVTAAEGPAYAEPPAQGAVDAASARADELAHKGNDLALKDKWAEAEVLFQQAWALKQSYDIGGNLGITEFALGKYRDAAEYLSFALAHFPANGKAEHRELLQEKLAKAREQVGARSIEVNVAGAEVLVDGVSIGLAPLAGEVFLAPGTRTIEAKLAGYDATKRTVDVAAGSTDRLVLTLRPSGSAGAEPKPPPWRPGPALIVPAAVLAVVGIGVGAGLTVAANGKRSSADTQRAQLTGSGATCMGTLNGTIASECQTLQQDATSRDTLSKGAVAGFVVGGAFAVATGVLLGWRATTAPKDSRGVSVRVLPAVSAKTGSLLLVGEW